MNQLRHYGFIGFLILCPLVFGAGLDVRPLQEQYFQYFAICLISLFIGNRWLSAFLILNVVSYIYNGTEVGAMQVLNILLGCLLFMVSRAYFKNNHFENYYKPILFVTALSVFWMALQIFNLDPLFTGRSSSGEIMRYAQFSEPVGLFGINMASGIFLTISLPILASFSFWVAPFLIIPILLSKSSGVILSLGVVSLFYTFYLHRKIFRVLVFSLPVLAGLFFYNDMKDDKHTFLSRFPVWHCSVKQALLNPLGYGPDSYRNINKHKNFMFRSDYDYNTILSFIEGDKQILTYYSPTNDTKKERELTEKVAKDGFKQDTLSTWDNPHNEYIQTLFQYGIFGIFLLFGFMFEMFNRFKEAIKDKELITITACLLVYFVSGVCQFPFGLARTAYLFPIFLGVFYSKTEKV